VQKLPGEGHALRDSAAVLNAVMRVPMLGAHAAGRGAVVAFHHLDASLQACTVLQ
jgi:hypothetical protein